MSFAKDLARAVMVCAITLLVSMWYYSFQFNNRDDHMYTAGIALKLEQIRPKDTDPAIPPVKPKLSIPWLIGISGLEKLFLLK